eukprot:CAMPEP_0113480984 /NCGR_PEP_ID=MMETSP0014_2-20120614/22166_1 /TAXON_ID=2857 /ORGANISM="Nitzschia sp." /LENGTH=965 /DNA_ID=CAMNT_0000374449 /DNA_START=462 /DNA_END=3356 /DNA_ORIENTATION=+ /assembly_acc=CAM_ASM_000159
MQQSTQQQQQQQKMSNLSSPPEQQQQRNRNRRLHRNCCRRSHGSSSSNNNNTLTTTAEVKKKKKKPRRSSDSCIVHGGGHMTFFQFRLLVSSLISIILIIMMMMMLVSSFLVLVTLPSGYRSSSVHVGIIGPRNHQFEKTTQTQTGYYEYYFNGVCSGGRMFPVVTAFQQQQRTYRRRSREPTSLGRSSKSTKILRRHRPPFHQPLHLNSIEGDEREYHTMVKKATTTMLPMLFGKLETPCNAATSSVDLRRSTDHHDEWNVVPSDVDVDGNASNRAGTHDDSDHAEWVGASPISVQHTASRIVMDTLGLVQSRRPRCQLGYQSQLRRRRTRRTMLFATKRDDGVGDEGRGDEKTAIHYLRDELRQLLSRRPSRNTAVDATILLKKMMSTDARVYGKGRRRDQINVIDCTQVISAIGKSGHKLAPQMALSVLNDMIDLYKKGNKYIRADVFAYTSVINAYARRGDVDGASKVFKMQVDDFKQSNNTDAQPNIMTYNTMMNAWAKSRRQDAVEAVEKLFVVVTKLYERGELEEGPDVVTYSTLIDCWSKSRRKESPAKSLQYLKDMEAMGIKPDVMTYNGVLDAHAKQGDVDGALNVLETMQGEAKPDRQSYSILLDAWAKSGRDEAPAEAMKLLMTIKDLHAAGEIDAPNVITFNTALDAHAKQGDVDGTLKVFEMMQGEVKPELRSYSILIDAWAKSGRSEAPVEAMKLLMTIKDLHAAGMIDAPDIITFTTVMDAHAKHGDVGGALKVLEMMSGGEVKPDLQTYSILIDAWAKSGRSEAPVEAMKLLMTIKDLHTAGEIDTPTVVTYNLAMDAHAKHGGVDGALKVFEMMSDGEVKPVLQSYNILIDAWAKSGRAEAPAEAMKLLMTIKDLYAAGEIDAQTIITYNSALDAHAKHGDVDGALKVLAMIQGEVKPDLQSYSILIDAWAESGRPDAPEQAEELLKKIEVLHGSCELYEPPGVQTF